MDNMTLQLALKFPGGGHYVTNVVDLYYFKTGQDRMDMLKHLVLQVPGNFSHHAVPSSRVILHEGLSVRDFDHFKPIDATPFHMDMEKDHKLEDLVVFRPLPTSEIVCAGDGSAVDGSDPGITRSKNESTDRRRSKTRSTKKFGSTFA
jgi:hypothetical protein